MNITVQLLDKVTPAKFTKAAEKNAQSVVDTLAKYASHPTVQLDLPHRQAHFLAQLFHENGDFRYDREARNKDGSLTPAQKRYEGRADLGNTQPGDGERFMGRTAIQITGRSNYRQFTKWVRKIDPKAPDFEQNPELVNTDPWEGLGPIWYWSTRKLNDYADANDIEMITRKINGGVNGFDDRIEFYTRVGLVLAGYGPSDVRQFQGAAQSRGLLPAGEDQLDGDPGPKTRAAIHRWLALKASAEIIADPEITVTASPVTTTKEVAVAPKGVENSLPDIGKVATVLVAGGATEYVEPVLGTFNAAVPWVQALLIVIAVSAAIWFFYGRQMLANRAKNIKENIKERADAGLPV